jgi:DNA-binding transcriptional regulator YdaS (Cro superfamily)
MTLHEWIDSQQAEYPSLSRTYFMQRLREVSGVSMTTLSALDRGARLTRADKAHALINATKGAVTLEDLL